MIFDALPTLIGVKIYPLVAMKEVFSKSREGSVSKKKSSFSQGYTIFLGHKPVAT